MKYLFCLVVWVLLPNGHFFEILKGEKIETYGNFFYVEDKGENTIACFSSKGIAGVGLGHYPLRETIDPIKIEIK